MIRLQVVLDPEEAELLEHWAQSEMRDIRDQIRFMLQQELKRRGLISINHFEDVHKLCNEDIRDDE